MLQHAALRTSLLTRIHVQNGPRARVAEIGIEHGHVHEARSSASIPGTSIGVGIGALHGRTYACTTLRHGGDRMHETLVACPGSADDIMSTPD